MWTINKDKTWQGLQQFGWVRDMHGVPQSPVHHAEGDVAAHTQMVISALEKLPEYGILEEQEKEIVWAAALLHDVEKRSTTSVDNNGEIVSPGHAKKGAITTRSILYCYIPTPFEIREKIVGLVRHHGLPLWVFHKTNPVQTLLKASFEVNTKWLAMLAKADVLGRICNDADELLYRIGLFEELCKENDCWGKPKEFLSDLARVQYFRKEDQSPNYLPFENTWQQAIIMSGIAGSGKDFYIKQHYPDYAVISLDDMRRQLKIDYKDAKGNGRVIQAAKEQAKIYLRSHTPFVWNATNITLQMREQLIDLMMPYNPAITIVYVEVPYKKLMAQNRNRNYPIPSSAIEKMIGKLEVPKAWEAHLVRHVIQ
jgi:predicted kinase